MDQETPYTTPTWLMLLMGICAFSWVPSILGFVFAFFELDGLAVIFHLASIPIYLILHRLMTPLLMIYWMSKSKRIDEPLIQFAWVGFSLILFSELAQPVFFFGYVARAWYQDRTAVKARAVPTA